jgi:hypothetical protein
MYQHVILVGCFVWGSILLLACGNSRKPNKYIIPEGYIGWVKIYYEVPDAQPLSFENGYLIYRIPSTGILKTSSKMEGGVAVDKYFYDTGNTLLELKSTDWGKGGMIWAGYTGVGGEEINGNPASYLGFFVGTEEDLKKYGLEMKDKVGPIQKAGSR